MLIWHAWIAEIPLEACTLIWHAWKAQRYVYVQGLKSSLLNHLRGMTGVVSRHGATVPGKKGTVGSTLGQHHMICGFSETSITPVYSCRNLHTVSTGVYKSDETWLNLVKLPLSNSLSPTRPVVRWHLSLYDRCHSQKIFSYTVAMTDRGRFERYWN